MKNESQFFMAADSPAILSNSSLRCGVSTTIGVYVEWPRAIAGYPHHVHIYVFAHLHIYHYF
ncbi:hypothetical protein [Mucilaginibacter boryungensis]|uniref:Uncharacterized protein n=1 Tax=Mucilaginibacter boryungensis TaxID=768480 RepID=A0ABR9XL18_9SPHI|nr:hypothetical protein [Mucilaginibacter boryungensis]MBE9667764.1 hypothetical protein [Mucilaginibacter boryungensis]